MLITTVENNIATVQLNNGKVNAISHQLIKELKESFLSLAENSLVHGVILTGHTSIYGVLFRHSTISTFIGVLDGIA